MVLLDVLMPGTVGSELMEQIAELADLPIIFVSRYGRDETIARALEAGAADYIVKPLFSPTELAALPRPANPVVGPASPDLASGGTAGNDPDLRLGGREVQSFCSPRADTAAV